MAIDPLLVPPLVAFTGFWLSEHNSARTWWPGHLDASLRGFGLHAHWKEAVLVTAYWSIAGFNTIVAKELPDGGDCVYCFWPSYLQGFGNMG